MPPNPPNLYPSDIDLYPSYEARDPDALRRELERVKKAAEIIAKSPPPPEPEKPRDWYKPDYDPDPTGSAIERVGQQGRADLYRPEYSDEFHIDKTLGTVYSGVVGALGGLARGTEALAGAESNVSERLRRHAEEVTQYPPSFGKDVLSGLGSMLPFMAAGGAGAVGGVLSRAIPQVGRTVGPKLAARLGQVAGVGSVGTLQHLGSVTEERARHLLVQERMEGGEGEEQAQMYADEALRDIKRGAGLREDEAMAAVPLSLLLGAVEAARFDRFIGKFFQSGSGLVKVAENVGEEAFQEGSSEFLTQLYAKRELDMDVLKDTAYSAAVGATVGGLMGGGQVMLEKAAENKVEEKKAAGEAGWDLREGESSVSALVRAFRVKAARSRLNTALKVLDEVKPSKLSKQVDEIVDKANKVAEAEGGGAGDVAAGGSDPNPPPVEPDPPPTPEPDADREPTRQEQIDFVIEGYKQIGEVNGRPITPDQEQEMRDLLEEIYDGDLEAAQSALDELLSKTDGEPPVTPPSGNTKKAVSEDDTPSPPPTPKPKKKKKPKSKTKVGTDPNTGDRTISTTEPPEPDYDKNDPEVFLSEFIRRSYDGMNPLEVARLRELVRRYYTPGMWEQVDIGGDIVARHKFMDELLERNDRENPDNEFPTILGSVPYQERNVASLLKQVDKAHKHWKKHGRGDVLSDKDLAKLKKLIKAQYYPSMWDRVSYEARHWNLQENPRGFEDWLRNLIDHDTTGKSKDKFIKELERLHKKFRSENGKVFSATHSIGVESLEKMKGWLREHYSHEDWSTWMTRLEQGPGGAWGDFYWQLDRRNDRVEERKAKQQPPAREPDWDQERDIIDALAMMQLIELLTEGETGEENWLEFKSDRAEKELRAMDREQIQRELLNLQGEIDDLDSELPAGVERRGQTDEGADNWARDAQIDKAMELDSRRRNLDTTVDYGPETDADRRAYFENLYNNNELADWIAEVEQWLYENERDESAAEPIVEEMIRFQKAIDPKGMKARNAVKGWREAFMGVYMDAGMEALLKMRQNLYEQYVDITGQTEPPVGDNEGDGTDTTTTDSGRLSGDAGAGEGEGDAVPPSVQGTDGKPPGLGEGSEDGEGAGGKDRGASGAADDDGAGETGSGGPGSVPDGGTGPDSTGATGTTGSVRGEETPSGSGGESSTEGGRGVVPDTKPPDSRPAYDIENRDTWPISTVTAYYNALQAIKTMREQGLSMAPPELIPALLRFGGTGGIKVVFNKKDKQTGKAAEILPLIKELFGDEAAVQAELSTLNAHYTTPAVAHQMWSVLQGYRGTRNLNVVELGAGNGVFAHVIPESMQGRVGMTMIEADIASVAIFRAMNQRDKMHLMDINDFHEQGTRDVFIGNVPFSENLNLEVRGPLRADRFAIHNASILKGIHALRPGGIGIVITSRFTLDSTENKHRVEMSNVADLIGVVRLPKGAFKGHAKTEVVTDILMFYKRPADQLPISTEWTRTTEQSFVDPKSGKQFVARINNLLAAEGSKLYEAKHDGELMQRRIDPKIRHDRVGDDGFVKWVQGMALGVHTQGGTMYGGEEYALELPDEWDEVPVERISRSLIAQRDAWFTLKKDTRCR